MSAQKEKVTFPLQISRADHARFIAANTNDNLQMPKDERTTLHDFILECALYGLKQKEAQQGNLDGQLQIASEI